MPFESKNLTPSGKASEIAADLVSPGHASNEGSCCKENININKSETSKLNIEPLQMKRKKRGGCYNLRKSLAWDRAFFTEEGVLDPLELSMITGASCRELPVIDDGAPGGSQLTTEPLDLQRLENCQLKILRNEVLSEERSRGCFSAKAHSSSSKLVVSTSMASHKVSTHLGPKYVSKYGESPQPVPSSSLKRPASVNASKAAAKELKLPKVPSSVTGFSSIRTTNSSMLRVNHLKHNQIIQPVLNIQMNAGSKISLKSHKNQTATKPGSLQPTCHPERNSGTSSVNRYSSAYMSLQPGDNAYNSGSKNIAANVNSSSLLHSPESRDKSATFSASFSQNAQSIGRIMHLSQNQNMKPSGLRMPSPSISFFSQPKAYVSNSLSSRDADIDACGSQKPGNSRLRDKVMRTPGIIDNITENINRNSISICPKSRCFMPSTADVILSDALNIDKTCNTLSEDKKFVDGQTDDVYDKKGDERILSPANVDFLKVDNEILSQIYDRELEMDGKNFQVANHNCTAESQSCGSGWRNLETTAEENSEIHKSDAEKATDEPCEEQNTFDVSITNYDTDFETHLEDEIDDKGQNSKMMQGGYKDTCKPVCCKPFVALTDELKYPPSEIGKRCVETMERPIELVGLSQLQSSSCDEEETSEALEHGPANVRSSDFGSEYSDRQDEKVDSIDVTDDKLQAGEAPMQDAVFALTIPYSKNKVHLVPEVGDDIKESAKTLMIQDVCLGVELDSLRTDEYHTSDGLLFEKGTCFQKSQQEEIVETHPLVGLDRNDRNKLNKTNMDRHLSLVEKHDCNYDKVEVIEQTLTNTKVDFVDNSPSLIHKTFNRDGIYVCKASYFELAVPSRETMQAEVSFNGAGDDSNYYLRNDNSEKFLLHDPANESISEVLYLDNGTMEIGHCSSFPKTNDHELSQIMYNEVTQPVPLIKDDIQMIRQASSLSLLEGGLDIDNQRNISDSMLAQPPEMSTFNECCIDSWQPLELPNVRSKEAKISGTNDGLHIKNYSQNKKTDEPLEDDSLGSMFANVAGSNDTHKSISEVLYLDNGTTGIDHCSSFPKTNDHEVSQIMYNVVTESVLLIKDNCQMNREASCLSLQEGGFDIDNQRNISDSRNMLTQPPETNTINEWIDRWQHLELPNVRSEEEKISRTNDGSHTKNCFQNQRIDESLEDDSLGSMFANVAGSNVTQFGAVKNTCISAYELSLKSECCSVSYGTDGQSCFVDAITDPASIEPFSDVNTVEIHQETNNSTRELHPNSDHDNSISALATNNNKYWVGRNDKSHACILQPSTIPFSDEWLTAIEAAGEEILTRKGGAVQNSPPDKLVPEPSPWSPVKKKNNQIGPFDCTKFSNNLK